MAEGRMLKKQISQSRRLSELKTDSARLLYTWIIPHLDVEGRINADPGIIKGSVVPRLDGMTPGVIRECLLDMHRVGVITLYEVDGDFYLEVRKFAEHQSLRKDKESASKIPAISAGTPAELPANSGPAPAEVKLSQVEVKSREENGEKPSGKPTTTPRFSKNLSCPEGVDPSIYEQFLANCKLKDKPFTERVLTKTVQEAASVGIDLNTALTFCVDEGHARFYPEAWNKKKQNGSAANENCDEWGRPIGMSGSDGK